MKPITKDMCLILIRDYYNGRLFSHLGPVLLISLYLCIYHPSLPVYLICVVVLATSTFFHVIWTKRKLANIHLIDFYLTEDIVIAFKKRFSPRKHISGHSYVYTFSNHGKFKIFKSIGLEVEIPLGKKKSINYLEIEHLSSQARSEGDHFYLLILNGRKRKIIQAFYQDRFQLDEKDFDFIDGKYYCNGFQQN